MAAVSNIFASLLKVYFLFFSIIKFSFEIFDGLWSLGYILFYPSLCFVIRLKWLTCQWFYFVYETKIIFHWHAYMNILCQETFRTTKLIRLLWESPNAFAESPETLARSQKLLINPKILNEVTKKCSFMVKGKKISICLRRRWFDEHFGRFL